MEVSNVFGHLRCLKIQLETVTSNPPQSRPNRQDGHISHYFVNLGAPSPLTGQGKFGTHECTYSFLIPAKLHFAGEPPENRNFQQILNLWASCTHRLRRSVYSYFVIFFNK